MDRQVPVFLYSIGGNSSFTLSSPGEAPPRPPKPLLKQRFARANTASGRHYHFCVLKNEETLFLMMKRPG
jgi:hypothetical protein